MYSKYDIIYIYICVMVHGPIPAENYSQTTMN